MKNKLLALAGGVAVTTGSFLVTETAQALQFNFTPSNEYSNSGSTISGTVTAVIEANGSDSATVTIDTSGLDGSLSEYVSGLYLNTDPTKSYGGFTFADGGGTQSYESAQFDEDDLRAGPDGFFDIQIDFPTSNNDDRFVADEISTVIISAAGLETNDLFNYLSVPGPGQSPGPFYAALRMRSLDADGEGSGWFSGDPVPEPLTIFGSGLALGFGGLFKKKYGQKKNELS